MQSMLFFLFEQMAEKQQQKKAILRRLRYAGAALKIELYREQAIPCT